MEKTIVKTMPDIVKTPNRIKLILPILKIANVRHAPNNADKVERVLAKGVKLPLPENMNSKIPVNRAAIVLIIKDFAGHGSSVCLYNFVASKRNKVSKPDSFKQQFSSLARRGLRIIGKLLQDFSQLPYPYRLGNAIIHTCFQAYLPNTWNNIGGNC